MATRRSGKSFFTTHWFLLGGVVLLCIMVAAYIRAVYQNYEIQSQINQLRQETAELQAKKVQTLNTLQYVKSPAYAEAAGRSELNLMATGEHVVVVTGNAAQKQGGQPMAPVLNSSQSPSTPMQWWHYFFH